MSDLPLFTLDFTPTLNTREMIKATVCFLVEARTLGHALAVWTPHAKLEPAREKIRQRVFAYADSVTNQWGLQFPSADAALARTAYESLASELSAIASPDFKIKKVVVRSIVPISERVKVNPPQPIKPSFTDQVLHSIDEVIPAFEALQEKEETLKRTKPELWNDPILGGTITSSPSSNTRMPEHTRGSLRRMLDDMKNDLIQYRRPR